MQNFLLTIAGVVILAIAAAFAAPYVVDWTPWRATFEAQAARVVGAPVLIRGPIEARLLPTPAVVLRDVSVGLDAGGTGLVVRQLDATMALGDLMRGRITVQSLRLVEPRGRLVIDATGKVALPTGAGSPTDLSVTAFTLEQGRFDIIDRAGGRMLVLTDIAAAGSLVSLAGPLKLDGEVTAGGARQRLRLGIVGFGTDGASKLRLSLQKVDSPFLIDIDGQMKLAGGRPGFEGKASFSNVPPSQPRAPELRGSDDGAAAPAARWSLSGTVNATPASVEAKNLALTLGSAERPVELAGSGKLVSTPATPSQAATSRIELDLSARQIDLNAATGGAPPLAALNEVARTIAPLAELTSSGRLDLSADTVLVAGAAMRELKSGLDWSNGYWSVRGLDARLPGGARVQLSGKVAAASGNGAGTGADPLFAGRVTATADDLPSFMAWAAPQVEGLSVSLPAGAARIEAGVSFDDRQFSLSAMTLSAGGLTLDGSASYAYPVDGGRGRVAATLASSGVDIDGFALPVRRLIGASGSATDISLGFSGQNVKLAGVPAARIELALTGGAQGIDITRLALTDFGGLDVAGAGKVTGAGDADGDFRARITGAKADGLAALARFAGYEGAAAYLASFAGDLAPVDVEARLVSSKGRMTLDADGRAGGLSGKGVAAFGGVDPATGSGTFDIADGSAALTRLGVPGLRPKLGPALLEFAIGSRAAGSLAFAGAMLKADGTLARRDNGGFAPDLAVTLEGADLARLLPDLAAGGPASLPATLAGRLTRQEDGYGVSGLTGTIAGTPLAGRLVYRPDAAQPLLAELTLPEWNLHTALALATGRSTGPGLWATGAFGPAPLARASAELTLDIARLAVPGGLTLEGAKLHGILSPGVLRLDGLRGRLAGGEIGGRAELSRNGAKLQADASLTLTGAASGPLLAAAGVARPAAQGTLDLSLDLTGAGTSPAALAATLAGQGSLTVNGLEIAATAPAALQYVMLATERGLPPELRRIAQLYEEGLGRGPLKLPKVEATLGMVGGVARSSVARLVVGEQRFALSGSLDLTKLSFDTLLEMEDVAPPGAPSPAASVRWGGPLAAPERRVDVTALSSAINMRALERETKRLESEYGHTPLTNAGHSTDVPDGTAAPMLEAQPQPMPPAAPAPVPQTAPVPRRNPPPVTLQPVQRAPAAPAYGAVPGSPAPPLPPPVQIPPDVLLNPIMQPPLAP